MKSSSHHPRKSSYATQHCQVQPSTWVSCRQYLQEWNKVVLFQVITARLGQEVHKFSSVVVTGLQSPGGEKREQMVARLLPYVRSILFYHSFKSTSLKCFPPKVQAQV